MSVPPPRQWNDVAEGEELKGFDLELTMTRMVLQVSGTQDVYPVHHDPAFAEEAGHEAIFANTAFIRGCLCRLLTDWMGPDGFLKTLRFQMRRPNFLGETVQMRGRVTRKHAEGLVELDVWLENTRHGVTASGSAGVILPRRA
jgi:3-oxo-4,17-pregnadiene-20-carboxyl-CoA hydratase beta subunit